MIRVLVDTGGWPDVREPELIRAAEAACLALGVCEAEISVALLDDDAMIELGRAHLGKSHPTDVIAFSLYEDGEPVLGDVYIGARQAERQAGELGVSLLEEWVRLVVHGTLHVLGMDHPEDPEARDGSPMYRRQEAVVRELMTGAAGTVRRGPSP